MKQIICTVCPQGCEMEVSEAAGGISVGCNGCPRGEAYARSEYANPIRLFTSLVRVSGGSDPLVAVRSTRPIPRKHLHACVDALRGLTLQAPVVRYTIVLENIFDTGVDIVTSGRAD